MLGSLVRAILRAACVLTKWQEFLSLHQGNGASMEETFCLPRHPLDIKPSGNAYTILRSIQSPFQQIPDELLVQILELLGPKDLLRLGQTSKALFAFSRNDEFWKTFCISCPSQSFSWRGTWYASYAKLDSAQTLKIPCSDLCSDILYRPFQCAHTPLEPYTTRIPAQNVIKRFGSLSKTEFAAKWTNTPFILTDPVKQWPIYQNWSEEELITKYADTIFRAESVDWPLKTYIEYMNNNTDESPLYLFDRRFAEKMDLEIGHTGDYWIPDCFGEDLFAVLNDKRPDSRWLIVGPARSGSTFHKDPNATSAWNAVLRGSKYWIMFPASQSLPPPPGVFVSKDQSEVTSPLSIAEWLMAFHAEARHTPGCVEAICDEGEILHVPSGWWHLVVNLKPSIALTQNFVHEAHLIEVLKFLRDKPNQVSGFEQAIEDPYLLFVEQMQLRHPDVIRRALDKIDHIKNGKKRKWESVVDKCCASPNSDEQVSNGFKFGFGGEDDEDIP